LRRWLTPNLRDGRRCPAGYYSGAVLIGLPDPDGKIKRSGKTRLTGMLQAVYQPCELRLPAQEGLGGARAAAVVERAVARPQACSEFMPPLYEGDLLYMPTTLPEFPSDEAANIAANHHRYSPNAEVERVYGKAGRADTGAGPRAAVDVRNGDSPEAEKRMARRGKRRGFIKKLDREVNLPGLTNSWGLPHPHPDRHAFTGIPHALASRSPRPTQKVLPEWRSRSRRCCRKVRGTVSVLPRRLGRALSRCRGQSRAGCAVRISVADVGQLIESATAGKHFHHGDGAGTFPDQPALPAGLPQFRQCLSQSRVTIANGESVPLGNLARLSIHGRPDRNQERERPGWSATFTSTPTAAIWAGTSKRRADK